MVDSAAALPDETAHPLLILWGSETGNSQDAAERIARDAQRRHFRVKVMEMDAYPIHRLS
ncbi:hypothetical protein FRC03_002864 [Tulasnella sp. 419]|nr:hypothetical protein FRC03_002864 [Tulasnella sp. 419]